MGSDSGVVMTSRTELANAIRALAMDAVQKAKSGHPGAPMGMADIAEVLWNNYLKHNPENPQWADRDRFILSNGHGSMLIYSLLHLSGYDLSIDDLKNFRQLHSKTPGHPEYGYAPGIETTTGPLGLGKLIAFYDDNGISIDGEVEGWFTDDTVKRFESYGWQVIPRVNGHDPEEIKQAIETARANSEQPTLICCKTIIGFGSPNKEGKEDCHGAPLGDDEIALTRERLGWKHGAFEIPEDVYAGWSAKEKGAAAESAWDEKFAAYAAAYPELAAEYKRRISGDLPVDFAAHVNK